MKLASQLTRFLLYFFPFISIDNLIESFFVSERDAH